MTSRFVFAVVLLPLLSACIKDEPAPAPKTLTEAQKQEIAARLTAPVTEPMPVLKLGGLKVQTPLQPKHKPE